MKRSALKRQMQFANAFDVESVASERSGQRKVAKTAPQGHLTVKSTVNVENGHNVHPI